MFTPETERYRQEKIAGIEAMSTRTLIFRVANIFWVQKRLEDHPKGFDFHPYTRSPEESARGYDQMFADENSDLVFPVGRLVLGKTLESVFVPTNETWWIDEIALNDKGHKLPLLTHCTAPLIKPGQHGNITYEFVNKTKEDLKLNIGKILAKVYVLPVDKSDQDEASAYNGQFQGNTWESLPFPDMRKELDEIRFLKGLEK